MNTHNPGSFAAMIGHFCQKNTFKQTHHVAGFALTSQVDQLCHKFAMHSFPTYIPQHFFFQFCIFLVSKNCSCLREIRESIKKRRRKVTTSELWHEHETKVPKETSLLFKATWKSAVEVITPPKITDCPWKRTILYKGNVVFQTIIFQGRVVSFRRSIVNLFLLMRRYDSDGSVGAKQGFWELRILAYNVRFEMK